MLDGIRLVFFRFIKGILLLLVLGPIILAFTEFGNSLDYNHFMGGVGFLLLGLDMITWILIMGIVGAVFYLYYRIVAQRKYENEESYYRRDYE